ncbi:restriction endonuclease subunit S [Streptococcus suis]|uniref:restriction endonuclease subunit S n=1 Tax=Streptococcus suis TaxID=1307 RepID=UPI000CF4A5FA|nr:restriction endonuclease subunit S [Streptococcus suis]
MKTNNNIPAYRFQGYTDAWELRKLGEVGYAKSGVGFPEKEQGGLTGIPFFKVSDMNIDGNENELTIANNYVTDEQISRRKWRVITEVPAIFFAKVGAAVMLNRKRLIRQPFLLDNNTMTYIFNHSQWDSDFGKILFEKIDLTKLTQVGALPSYNSSDVENINILIPTLPEQSAIGTFFSTIDRQITLHQRKLDTLKEQKKTYLKLLFPAKGQTQPALRFQGFKDDWEEVKLGEILKERNEQIAENEEYPLMSFVQGVGVTPKGERYDRSFLVKEDNKKYKKTELGDFIYSSNNLETGSIGFNKTGKAVISPVYSIFYSKDEFESSFIGILSQRKDFIAKMIKFRQGVVYGQWRIHENDFLQILLHIPTKAEMEKIITFFQTLDQEIAQVEDKLASLKEMKKTLLRKLFV